MKIKLYFSDVTNVKSEKNFHDFHLKLFFCVTVIIAIISEVSESDEIQNKEEAPKECEVQKLEEIQSKEVPEKFEVEGN